MIIGYIYVIKNLINDKIYIGQTSKTLTIRFKEHKRDMLKLNLSNMLIYKAMNKYGVDNFIIRPIDILKCETVLQLKILLDEKEIYYIKIFNCRDRNIGYNLTDGGGGCTGRIASKDTCEKLSKSKLGEKNPMFGTKWSNDKREQMIERMSGENNHNYGKQITTQVAFGKFA